MRDNNHEKGEKKGGHILSLLVFTTLFSPILIKFLISNVASRQIDNLHIFVRSNVPKYLRFHVNYTLHFRKDQNSQTLFRILSYHTSYTDAFTARESAIFRERGSERGQKILRSTIYSVRCFSRKLRIMSTNNVPLILDETNIMRYTKRKSAYPTNLKSSEILVDLITDLSYTKLRFIFSRGKLA